MSRTMHHDAIVTLRGELDEMSRGEIARSLAGLERCHHVLIDLSEAECVHSGLLSELVLLKRRCVVREAPPSIELRCNRAVARLMQVVGIDRLFEINCA